MFAPEPPRARRKFPTHHARLTSGDFGAWPKRGNMAKGRSFPRQSGGSQVSRSGILSGFHCGALIYVVLLDTSVALTAYAAPPVLCRRSRQCGTEEVSNMLAYKYG